MINIRPQPEANMSHVREVLNYAQKLTTRDDQKKEFVRGCWWFYITFNGRRSSLELERFVDAKDD